MTGRHKITRDTERISLQIRDAIGEKIQPAKNRQSLASHLIRDKRLASYALSSMESSNEDNGADEIQRINVVEMKERFGEGWRDKVSSVRESRQADGSVIKEYIIEDSEMIDQLADLNLNCSPLEIGEKQSAVRNVERLGEIRNDRQIMHISQNREMPRSYRRSHHEPVPNRDSMDGTNKAEGENSGSVQYEVVDVNGNRVDIVGNLNQLKQMAGSMKEVKQPDGTIVKEYLLDDPDLINQIHSNAYTNQQAMANSGPEQQHSAFNQAARMAPPPPPRLPMNSQYNPQSSDLLEITPGLVYKMRSSTGRSIQISVQGGQCSLIDLQELRYSLDKIIAGETNRLGPAIKKKQVTMRAESLGTLGTPATQAQSGFKDQRQNFESRNVQSPPNAFKSAYQNISRAPSGTKFTPPTLVDLSNMNPALGTYQLDEKGRIIGDVSYKLTRQEIDFIQDHLLRDGVRIDLSNVKPIQDRKTHNPNGEDYYKNDDFSNQRSNRSPRSHRSSRYPANRNPRGSRIY